MQQHLSSTKTALAVGVFLGSWHVIWSLLVALNWAQPLYDFILWAHMIHLQRLPEPAILWKPHATGPKGRKREPQASALAQGGSPG